MANLNAAGIQMAVGWVKSERDLEPLEIMGRDVIPEAASLG